MTDISAYQHKFRATSDRSDSSNKINKRNRLPVSCLPCRTRKLKCDRGQPCDSCIKREDASGCSYTSSSVPNRTKHDNSRSRAQERLQHLEGLVMQMMNSDPAKKSKVEVAIPQLNGSTAHQKENLVGGLVACEGSEPSYVGGTHWAAILNNIQELKSDMGSMQSPPEDEYYGKKSEESRKESLFNIGTPSGIEVILQYLPPRELVDRRLSTYFKAKYIIVPIVHTQHFQRMYEAFWKDPTKVPPMWLAQLFGILGLSAYLSEIVGTDSSTPEGEPRPSQIFQNAAAQCLVLGDFTAPQRYVVEALVLYGQCKYLSTMDPAGEVWILFGVVIRLALRMGYHRDPKHLPFLSVFEGEMRRRTWTILRHFDLMSSFQMGLPSHVQAEHYDTALPSNLHDSDFDESCTKLPPPRPDTDTELMSYFVNKGKIMTVFEDILNHELSTRSFSYERIMELDKDLRQAQASIPAVFRLKPMSESIYDESHVIMARLNLDLVVQKSICILHRKYISQKSGKPYSRKVCAEAAMEILRRQAAVYQETQPGGQLYQDRWMFSSFTFNDFFLAAIVLCLDVLTNRQENPESTDSEQINTKLKMLQRSYLISVEQRASCKEARRVTDAMAIMLAKLKPDFVPLERPTPTVASSTNTVFPTPPTSIEDNQERGSSDRFSGYAATPALDPIQNLMSGSEQVDWAYLDQYLLDGSGLPSMDPNWPDAGPLFNENTQLGNFMDF